MIEADDEGGKSGEDDDADKEPQHIGERCDVEVTQFNC